MWGLCRETVYWGNLPSELVAMNTYFGWTIMGKTGEGGSASEVLLSLHVIDLKICDLNSLGIKEPSISQSKSEIAEAVKGHFVRLLRRDDEGRYQVSLPWLEVHPELSDNRNIAERRLKSCVRSLQKRNCLQECENIFKEWVSEKIIESVEPEELAREKGHFLPHQPVFKENSTTRISPVFEASAKERNSGSLNDCIEKGPNYLELIPKLLNRFRQGIYGVISDIRRAFLQIKVAPSDKKFLRFL
ncbi:integrase catalytic domain-containing protein [Trichonephila clavata]|uniref:Integrase catalytic domain-containing protein n=1 Tax=Trichonephila clavata TaxID=2740835 RepID=A0A8X6F9T2_TRICU|nr:integrase catalytic domain-containing protein [Trichonephila clavata]